MNITKANQIIVFETNRLYVITTWKMSMYMRMR